MKSSNFFLVQGVILLAFGVVIQFSAAANILCVTVVTLRAKLSGAVYCYRSCLCVCVFSTAGGRAGWASRWAVSKIYYN